MILAAVQGNKIQYRNRFLIQFGDRIRKVETSEIAYFYVFDKSVFLKTIQNQSYPMDLALDKIEEQLDPAKFFRINRKILIHMDSIRQMHAWSRSRIKLELIPPAVECEEVVVSIDRTPEFRKWLNS